MVGLTLGDPAGVGPELVARVVQRMGRRVPLQILGAGPGGWAGFPTLAGARQARQALEESVRLLKAGQIQAVVNGPVSKAWLVKAGFRFPGQTEFYARRLGLRDDSVTMCMVGPRLRVALVSTHLSLKRAVASLKIATIVRSGLHLAELLKAMGMRRPRIAVCGLNPHAGEGGLFGREDLKLVKPAVRQLRRKTRLAFSGPESGDTVFGRAVAGEFDGVVALYHDQGLIPAKLLDFDRTVNVTMGLPVVRCAPDHGPAFGIAGKGKASPNSMIEAVRLACRLAKRRK